MKNMPKWMLLKRILLGISLISLFMVPTALGETIRVGVLLPLSGRLAALGGEIERNSFIMAAEEINQAGGIGGKNLQLIIEDTEGKVSRGRILVEKLISEDQVAMLGGGFSSSVTWSTTVAAQDRKVPFLVNTASSDRITEGWRKWIYRLNTPVSEHNDTLASFIRESADIRTARVCYEETPFGRFWSDKFIEQSKETDLAILGSDGFASGTMDFIPYLTRLKEQPPDLLHIITNEKTAVKIMSQTQEVGLNPKLILGTPPGCTSETFQEAAADTSEYIYSQVLWSPNLPYPGAQEYHEKYLIKYGTPPDYHGAQAYAATQVMAHALKRAKDHSPDGIRKALADTRMMTVLGLVRFRSYGKKRNQNRLPTYLAQWIGGRLEIVWPLKAATETYVYPTP
ncbi:ABC transporter substrate-binding protein, partial [Thermodesulfobacteriota bacterium]